MTSDEFSNHTIALMDFLQARGLTEEESCAVMGNAISCMIRGTEPRAVFVKVLREQWKRIDTMIKGKNFIVPDTTLTQ